MSSSTILHLNFGPAGANPPAVFQWQAWRGYGSGPASAVRAVGSMPELQAIATASVQAIYCADTFEHIDIGLMPAMFGEFLRILKPEGYVAVTCADAPCLSHAYDVRLTTLTTALHGAGFQSAAGKRRLSAFDLWVVASKEAMPEQQIRQLAQQLFPDEIAARQQQVAPQAMADLLGRFEANDFNGVVAAARAMLDQHPCDGKVWHLRGVALLKMDQNQDAAPALCRASELLPADAEIWDHLGLALLRLRQFAFASQCFGRSVALDAGRLSAWSNAAKNANEAGDFAEGLRCAQRAIALDPTHTAASCNLAYALAELQRPDEAMHCYQKALASDPQSAELHYGLGTALMSQGRGDEAAASYRRALAFNPEYVEARCNLGTVLLSQGRHAEAADCFRRALALQPDAARMHGNLLFCLSHDITLTPAAIFAEHVAFGTRFENALMPAWPEHPNARDPQRRLRLGFVSDDLYNHAVAFFIFPVWAALDPASVELWVYSTHRQEDGITSELRGASHCWRQVADLSDDALAAQIRADGIDVLFDLSGHTAHNRLLVFARKPAPVQVTWIGYPNTTGLQAMDYVLCDRFNAPHGLYEHFYREKFARLPSSGTFSPPTGTPPVNPLPALDKGYITFGSFNRTNKFSDDVIATWSEVLREAAGSRLLLGHVGDPAQAQRLAARFAHHGIAPERLLFHPPVTLQDYLRLHHEVDLILDTWPYTGGTTTNFALWMGVPVVTLRGPSRAHCQSGAVLGRLGLEDWIARDRQEFVRIAVHWAGSIPALASLRAGLRERWQTAPLRQPATVARGLELAVRHMWQRWCAGLPAEHFEIAQASLPGLIPLECNA
ncbi:MAG: tetratricopeptide repeat protein [Pseudomonadota bacterium]